LGFKTITTTVLLKRDGSLGLAHLIRNSHWTLYLGADGRPEIFMRDVAAHVRRRALPRQSPPDGLRTASYAAAKLHCTAKTLNKYVTDGELRYVLTGHGTKRPRKMFTDADIDQFIAHRRREGSPACPSSKTRVHRIGASTSNIVDIGFSARPKPPPGGKPKR
jgi:hypothetical protein